MPRSFEGESKLIMPEQLSSLIVNGQNSSAVACNSAGVSMLLQAQRLRDFHPISPTR